MGQIWTDPDRQAAFFESLERLIGEYPEISERDADEVTDEILDGYNPHAPKMMSGLVLVIAYDNLDDWSEMSVLHPQRQSHYMTVGMLHEALGMQ